MEIKKEVKTYRVHKQCELTGCDGAMFYHATRNRELGAHYPHICNNCGAIGEYEVQYPYITHEEI